MHRVLVVEDAAPMSATAVVLEQRLGRDFAGSAASGAGLIVAIDTASTLEGALQHLQAQPDAIVLDARTLLLGELAHLVRAARSLSKPVLVLLISDATDDSLASIAWSVGANDWLTRPFSVEHIAQRVAEWFKKMK